MSNVKPWAGAPWHPRDWQKAAIPAIQASIRRREAPVVEAIMGAGKSVLIAELCWLTQQRMPENAVVVVATSTEQLTEQLSGTLAVRCGEGNVGRWYGRAKQIRPVIVACNDSLLTLAAALEEEDKVVALLVCDEVHRSEAPTLIEAVQALPRRNPEYLYRVGLSATPFRADPTERISLFDTVAFSYGLGDAMVDGVLVPWTVITSPEVLDLDEWCIRQIKRVAAPLEVYDPRDAWGHHMDVVKRFNDARQVRYDQWLQANDRGPDSLPPGWVRTDSGLLKKLRPGIANAANIAEAEDFAGQLTEAGIKAEPIHSRQGPAAKQFLLDQLAAGELDALVHVSMLQEGFDMPALAWGCLRRPVKSPVRFLQELGRFLRVHPSKAEAVIIDPHNLLDQHRLVRDPRLGEPAALNEIISSAVGLDEDEEDLDEFRDELPDLDLPPLNTPRRRLTAAVKCVEAWCLRFFEAAQVGGVASRGGYDNLNARWRSAPVSQKQIEAMAKMQWTFRYLPQELRESAAWIIRNPHRLKKGAASDLMSVQFGIADRLREAKEAGQVNERGWAVWDWPEASRMIPVPQLPKSMRAQLIMDAELQNNN